MADIPYSMSTRSYLALGISLILPEEEYLAHTSRSGAMNTSLTIRDDKEEEIENFLLSYTENETDEAVSDPVPDRRRGPELYPCPYRDLKFYQRRCDQHSFEKTGVRHDGGCGNDKKAAPCHAGI